MNLIGEDIKIMRTYYDEALEQQGIPCIYQYPLFATSNEQGEPVIDSYSDKIDTHIFFDGNPKIKTYKRYGWVVENDKELPFLIHCSFHLLHVLWYRRDQRIHWLDSEHLGQATEQIIKIWSD